MIAPGFLWRGFTAWQVRAGGTPGTLSQGRGSVQNAIFVFNNGPLSFIKKRKPASQPNTREEQKSTMPSEDECRGFGSDTGADAPINAVAEFSTGAGKKKRNQKKKKKEKAGKSKVRRSKSRHLSPKASLGLSRPLNLFLSRTLSLSTSILIHQQAYFSLSQPFTVSTSRPLCLSTSLDLSRPLYLSVSRLLSTSLDFS